MTDGERAFYAWRAAENARWREAHPLCDLSGVDDAIAERALARRSGRRLIVPYPERPAEPYVEVTEARKAWERKVAVWEREDRERRLARWPEDGPVMRLLLKLADQVARLVAFLVRFRSN